MKKIAFIFAALACCLGFAACSDDDGEIESSKLEGRWYLINEAGYDNYNGDNETWDDSYTFNQPEVDGDGEIYEIEYIGDNRYRAVGYRYSDGEWERDGSMTATLEGNRFVEASGYYSTISTLNAKYLVIEYNETNFYNKRTFQRMD